MAIFRENDGGRKRAGFHKEYSDCQVRSFAILTGMPYERAHAIYKKAGRENRERFNFDKIQLEKYGVKLHRDFKGDITLRDFLRIYSPGRFVLRAWGHVFAVIDGKVHDRKADRMPLYAEIQRSWQYSTEVLR